MSQYDSIKEQVDILKNEYFECDSQSKPIDFNLKERMHFINDGTQSITPKYINAVYFRYKQR